MLIDNPNKPSSLTSQSGFTLVEVMIVVAIIAILAAIAYPSYQRYVIKTKRTEAMSEMQNIASQLESRKLAQGTYSDRLTTGLGGNFPRQGPTLYIMTFTPSPLTAEWVITATPVPNSQVATDGTLTLNYLNIKCRGTVCNTGDDWNK